MHRIDTDTATPAGTFTEGNPQGGIPATQFSADWCNGLQEEVANFIEGQGIELDKLDNTQLSAAVEAALLGRNQFSNELVNGDFQIWQRGSAFTFPAGSVIGAYTADRFYAAADLDSGESGACTVSRQVHPTGQTSVPGDPHYYLRFQQSIAATGAAPFLYQRVEDVTRFFGKQLKVSTYIRSDVSISGTLVVSRDFGPSGSAGDEIYRAAFTIPNGWGRHVATVTLPDHAGESIDATLGHLEVRIEFPTGATFSCDISDFLVQFGTYLSPYSRVPMALEELRAFRYYEKSYSRSDAPGSTTGLAGTVRTKENLVPGTPITVPTLYERFRVEKRAVPTVTWYSPVTGAPDNLRGPGSLDYAVEAQYEIGTCETGYPAFDYGATTYGTVTGHWTAEAEL